MGTSQEQEEDSPRSENEFDASFNLSAIQPAGVFQNFPETRNAADRLTEDAQLERHKCQDLYKSSFTIMNFPL